MAIAEIGDLVIRCKLASETSIKGREAQVVIGVAEDGKIIADSWNSYAKKPNGRYKYHWEQSEVLALKKTDSEWHWKIEIPEKEGSLQSHESNPSVVLGSEAAALRPSDLDKKKLIAVPYRIRFIGEDGIADISFNQTTVGIDSDSRIDNEVLFRLPVKDLCPWEERKARNPYAQKGLNPGGYAFPVASRDIRGSEIDSRYPYWIMSREEDGILQLSPMHSSRFINDTRFVRESQVIPIYPADGYQTDDARKSSTWILGEYAHSSVLPEGAENLGFSIGDEACVLAHWDLDDKEIKDKKLNVVQIEKWGSSFAAVLSSGIQTLSLWSDGFSYLPFYRVRAEDIAKPEEIEAKLNDRSLFLRPGQERFYSNVGLHQGTFVVHRVNPDKTVELRRKGYKNPTLAQVVHELQWGGSTSDTALADEWHLLNKEQRLQLEAMHKKSVKSAQKNKAAANKELHGKMVKAGKEKFALDSELVPSHENFKCWIYPLADKGFLKAGEIVWGYVLDRKGTIRCVRNNGVFDENDRDSEKIELSFDEYLALAALENGKPSKHAAYIYSDSPEKIKIRPYGYGRNELKRMRAEDALKQGNKLCMKTRFSDRSNAYEEIRVMPISEFIEDRQYRDSWDRAEYFLLENEDALLPYDGFMKEFTHSIQAYGGEIKPIDFGHGRGYGYFVDYWHNECKGKVFCYNANKFRRTNVRLS